MGERLKGGSEVVMRMMGWGVDVVSCRKWYGVSLRGLIESLVAVCAWRRAGERATLRGAESLGGHGEEVRLFHRGSETRGELEERG